MLTVLLKIEKKNDIYKGVAKVRGFETIEFSHDIDELRTSLIDHLKEEDEIKEGNYVIEETLT